MPSSPTHAQVVVPVEEGHELDGHARGEDRVVDAHAVVRAPHQADPPALGRSLRYMASLLYRARIKGGPQVA